MKEDPQRFVVMYDVTDPKILQKIAKLLQQYGYERMNFSVWLGWNSLDNNFLLKKSIQSLLAKPEAKNSRFYHFSISLQTLARIRTINGKPPCELDYWLSRRQTMFF